MRRRGVLWGHVSVTFKLEGERELREGYAKSSLSLCHRMGENAAKGMKKSEPLADVVCAFFPFQTITHLGLSYLLTYKEVSPR